MDLFVSKSHWQSYHSSFVIIGLHSDYATGFRRRRCLSVHPVSGLLLVLVDCNSGGGTKHVDGANGASAEEIARCAERKSLVR
jgi:hypothetical protein